MQKSRKKVLVIEQNPSLSLVFESILHYSFDTFIVSNPFDAMDVLSENKIGCIILSVDKKNVQTHSLLQHLKSSKLLKKTPMVVLTDIEKRLFIRLYPKNGVTQIFKKPFNPLEVLETVNKICDSPDELTFSALEYSILNPN